MEDERESNVDINTLKKKKVNRGKVKEKNIKKIEEMKRKNGYLVVLCWKPRITQFWTSENQEIWEKKD